MNLISEKSPAKTSCQARGRWSVAQSGFSLIELMIAIAISLIILTALVALFVNVSRSNNELAKTNMQIENGRFAMQLLQADLVHAGFWGNLGFTQPVPPEILPSFAEATAIPGPCLGVASWDGVYKNNLLAIPVQGFANGSTLAGCNVASVLPSSDVLTVSHANTCTAGSANCDGGTDTGPHIQVSECPGEAPFVVSDVLANFVLKKKPCAATDIADRRKIISNIYYLANNANVPTLMRVSLVNGAYSAPQPLIEGIEAFRVEYGIDTLGKNGNPINTAAATPNYGDGSADQYVSCSPCTLSQLSNVVAVRVHVLARSPEPTLGYTDSKSYQLGGTSIAAAGDNYKRHVFSTTIRLVNPSARREVQ